MMQHHFKGFTKDTAGVLNTALILAIRQGQVNTGHILMAIVQSEFCPASRFLKSREVTAEKISKKSEEQSGSGRKRLTPRDFSGEACRALDMALLGAHSAHMKTADTEHLLCAILEDPACTASRWLRELGVDTAQALKECRQLSGQILPHAPGPVRSAPLTRSHVSEKYGKDLTRLASEGRLDPVLCRETELQRMVEVLCRRRKNNPCLIGEPGVGKTALAEALAQRIADRQVPISLQNKRILSLDLACIVAGTKYRGDFEERFKNLLEEVCRDQNTILFIDEIHIIVGAGAAEGAIDAASILKPLLARGEIQVIGATTYKEYRKFVQKDPALDRRFGQIAVEEPTQQQAVAILTGLADHYERYHHVFLSPEAIQAAVELSVRYLPDRFLPDKAVDLLDEASAAKRIETEQSGTGTNVLVMKDIAAVTARISGIPVQRINEEERDRLYRLEQRLNDRVIGQQEAVAAVAGAIRRARTGLRDPDRPMGSMLFLGPTGVGKTHLARQLALCWFGTEHALIRFDMSEYMEQHAGAKLIGAPPGYAGHGDGGQLTEAVRANPYSVVLFDEIEKAHPDVQNLLLQILEDGSLTDSMGQKADFRNTIILLTSNLGAKFLCGQGISLGFGGDEAQRRQHRRQQAIGEARCFFRPELMGRLDEVIVFDPLEAPQLCRIAEGILEELEHRAESSGYHLVHRPELVSKLVQAETNHYGARQLRRQISRAVEQALADQIAAGTIHPGQHMIASVQNGKMILEEDSSQECSENSPTLTTA